MKYYLIAGEASGDLHGANLMRALRDEDPAAEFRFWGGDAMAAVGGSPVRHIRDLAIMGFVEVVAHLGTVLGNLRLAKRDIEAYRPDVLVGIDYPGFNLRIEHWAHRRGIATAHYIAPNLWAWKKNRIKKMRRDEDLLCFILPFERRFFARNHMPQALYVGHPLLDQVATFRQNATHANRTDSDSSTVVLRSFNGSLTVNDRKTTVKLADNYRENEGVDSERTVALLPGSRRMELKNSMPMMVQLAQRHPEYRFVVAGMSLLGPEAYAKYLPEGGNVEVVYDRTYELLSRAHAAVVCSGTATLEAALFDVPQVVCYRANPISIAIAKAVVSRRISYISLVNLIADSPVVCELIQQDFNPERLEREFRLVADDEANRARMRAQYAAMRTLLGDGGASRRAASAIANIKK